VPSATRSSNAPTQTAIGAACGTFSALLGRSLAGRHVIES